MNVFNTVLFVHMLGLIGLFGGVVVLQLGGARLRAATTWPEARPWFGLLRVAPALTGSGGGVLLLTGLYMTHVLYTFATPWVVVAMVLVASSLVIGPMIVKPRMQRAAIAASGNEGTLNDAARAAIANPVLWSTIFTLNFAAFGILWLMTNKPGWTGSIAIPLALMVLGLLLGSAVARAASRKA